MVALLEAALSPSGQIILTSHHTAVMTIVAEAIRYYIGSWAGLYVPVAYGRYAQELIDEPAPYMLGFTKASKPLFNPPKDALVVDLDFNRIFTARPPGLTVSSPAYEVCHTSHAGFRETQQSKVSQTISDLRMTRM